MNSDEQMFWRQVFLASLNMRDDDPAAYAAAQADMAILRMRRMSDARLLPEPVPSEKGDPRPVNDV